MRQGIPSDTSLNNIYVQEATEYLDQIDCGKYTAGECFRVDGAWYGVHMSAEGAEPFCVYVRHTAQGVELRDDRVLTELNRQMKTLTQELTSGEVVCVPWVQFISGVPMQAWAAMEMLQDVNDRDALTVDWYVLFREEQNNQVQDLAVDLAVQLGSRGHIGTIYAVVADDQTIDTLSASPEREACIQVARNAIRIRVNGDADRTKEVILMELAQA